MILIFLLILLLSWVAAGLLIFWLGTRTPRPGSRRLLRTCRRKIAFVGSEITVELWPTAQNLPRESATSDTRRVVLVLDHSGSMGRGPGSGLEEARRAALAFVHSTLSVQSSIAVVAFDDRAEILCPIAAEPDRVTAALRGIGSGGCTNIAGGLETAGRVLEEHGPSEGAQEVVILLSDGGSAEAPATAAADRLKQRGIRVMAIALGYHVNRKLLEQLASGPEDCYHALTPEHLERVYHAAGSALDEDGGFRAHLQESAAVSSFAVADCGELHAYAVDVERGTLRWFLPFVAERPKRCASYRLLARRRGWHRVASQAAHLEMFGRDGLSYEATSNRSPHVLVLPRFAWPLGLLLLNPLFWLLFGRFGAFGSALRVRKLPSPRPIPLPAIEELQPARPSDTAISLTPTLLVGIGHTGGAVLRAFAAQLGEEPESAGVRLLWIDTGPSPPPAEEDEAGLGKPLREADQVLLPENLEPRLRSLRGSSPPQFEWFDAERELGSLRPWDFDLSRGTHGRRVLGRAALRHHLEKPHPALTEALDERLRSLPGDYRAVIVGNLAGGTGGGMLLDLLIYLKKRIDAVGRPARSIDALLLTHRAVDGGGELEPVYLGNTQAFAVELSRLAWQGDRPITLPQTPGETDATAQVRRFLDHVLVVECPLEVPEGARSRPAPVVHSAAQLLLQLLEPDSPAIAFLENQRRHLKSLERSSGQPMVFAAGAAWRRLPITEVRRLFLARILVDFLTQDLLLLERSDGGLVVGDDEIDRAAPALVTGFLSGRGLVRSAPVLLASLEPLADTESAAAELGRLLPQIDLLPGSNARPESAGEAVTREVLEAQQRTFDALLEEWALGCLNAAQEDGGFDPAARRGSLPRLHAAVRRLAGLAASAADNLRSLEESAREQGLGARFDFVTYLVDRYHRSIRGLEQHLDAWWQALVPDPDGPADRGASLIASALQEAAAAAEHLDRLAEELRPSICWSPEIEKRLLERFADPVRERLARRYRWLPDPIAGESTPRLALSLLDPRKPCDHLDRERLRRELEAVVHALGLAGIGDESLADHLDLKGWTGSAHRRDPVHFAANRHAEAAPEPAARREFLLLPRDGSVAGGVGPDLEATAGQSRHLSSIVRILSPCALAAVGGIHDGERRLAGQPHAALPLLDPADRSAADYEDLLPRFGMEARYLGPVLRSYFAHKDQLRSFLLASCLGMVERSPATSGEVLSLCGAPLTGDDHSNGEPRLLEALDRFVRVGRTARPEVRAIDRPAVAGAVEDRLAGTGDSELRRLTRAAESLLNQHLEGFADALRRDYLDLTRLFLELELERRQRQQGDAP